MAPAPALSRRLASLLDLVEPCQLLADVGTDHALVPAHAVLRGVAERALGVDVRSAPLRAAERTVSALAVGERVELVLGDGLVPLRGRGVDCLVLAGLSGETFIGWCEQSPSVLAGLERLVVQPNRQLREVRRWAFEAGWHLLAENVCEERGRFFVSSAFGPGVGIPDPLYERGELPPERAFELGLRLVERGGPVVVDYYEARKARLGQLVAAGRLEHGAALAATEAALKIVRRGS